MTLVEVFFRTQDLILYQSFADSKFQTRSNLLVLSCRDVVAMWNCLIDLDDDSDFEVNQKIGTYEGTMSLKSAFP